MSTVTGEPTVEQLKTLLGEAGTTIDQMERELDEAESRACPDPELHDQNHPDALEAAVRANHDLLHDDPWPVCHNAVCRAAVLGGVR